MFSKYPLKVALMDDDYSALMWNASIITRDPRTTVLIQASSPETLLSSLTNKSEIDIFLLDTECPASTISIFDLIEKIRSKKRDATIICLSQYYESEKLMALVRLKVNGLLIKGEIKMAIVPALLSAVFDNNTITPGVSMIIENSDQIKKTDFHVIPIWRPNPEITPQVLQCFWLRVFFGMRSTLVAKELNLAKSTVERYVNLAYQILQSPWVDDSYLFELNMEDLSSEDRAFVWFTSPPKLS